MTSLSEEMYETAAPNKLPAGLASTSLHDVSRLRFISIDQLGISTQSDSEIPVDEAGIISKEILELQEKLRLQLEETSQKIEAARDRAVTETRNEWEEKLDSSRREGYVTILRTLEEFRLERDRYFNAVEGEVVKLALAIAERILHREAKLDPLLLSGVVRVALENLADQSAVAVRVPLNDLNDWQMADAVDGLRPQIVGDERLRPGECVLDTAVGKVELGVAAQLLEIERGFFDLLQQRRA